MTKLSALGRARLLRGLAPGASSVRRSIAERVAAAADLLEVGARLDRRPGQLSGGQRQRVALGRATACVVRAP